MAVEAARPVGTAAVGVAAERLVPHRALGRPAWDRAVGRPVLPADAVRAASVEAARPLVAGAALPAAVELGLAEAAAVARLAAVAEAARLAVAAAPAAGPAAAEVVPSVRLTPCGLPARPRCASPGRGRPRTGGRRVAA